MRLDGTLGNLEKKWFQNGLFIQSRNSTRSKALKLDSFGGVFIANGAGLALAFIIASVCAIWDIKRIFLETMFRALIRLNLMGQPQLDDEAVRVHVLPGEAGVVEAEPEVERVQP
ncbi:hypothetical protein Tco_0326285 [Tanacetum coccineum]